MLRRADERTFPNGRGDCMKAPAEPDDVSISLSQDEALVLFEWLTAFNNKSEPQLTDQAEQRVLCDVGAMLMRSLKACAGCQ